MRDGDGPLQAALAELTANVFGGVRIDSGRWVVSIVAGEPLSTAVRDRLQEAAGAVPIRYETVAHSLADLTTWTDTLTEERDNLLDAGVELTSWGPDLPSNSVQVTLGTYTPAAEHTLRHAFPEAPLTVVPESNRPAPVPSRTPDTSP